MAGRLGSRLGQLDGHLVMDTNDPGNAADDRLEELDVMGKGHGAGPLVDRRRHMMPGLEGHGVV